MTAHDLASLVMKTLDKQKEYFTRHGKGYACSALLEESKQLERQLRQAAKDVLRDKGPGLFNEEER